MKMSMSVEPIKQPLSTSPKSNTCSNVHVKLLWRRSDKEECHRGQSQGPPITVAKELPQRAEPKVFK